MVLPSQISREAGALAAPVQAKAQHPHFTVLVLDRAFAVADGDVQAQSPGVARAKPARNVGGGVDLIAALPSCGQAREGFAARALGRQVDGPAHAAAAGRGAVQKGRRAPEDLDPLQQFGRHELARQNAVESVVGHVVRIDREAADDVQLLEITEALGDAHAWVVLQDVGDAAGLLVAHQFLGEAGRGERGVHRVQRAKQADPAARRHLAARIGRRQGDLRTGHHDVGHRRRFIQRLLSPGRSSVSQHGARYSRQQAKRWSAHERPRKN